MKNGGNIPIDKREKTFKQRAFLSDLNNFYQGFGIPNIIIYSLFIISIFLLIMAHLPFSYSFAIPPNNLFDAVYEYTDVEVITIVFSIFVFYLYAKSYSTECYFNKIIKSLKFQRVIIAIISTVILLGSMTILEKVLIKPLFDYDRYFTQIEHRIIYSYLTNGNEYNTIISDLNFTSSLGRKLQRNVNDNSFRDMANFKRNLNSDDKLELKRIFNRKAYYNEGYIVITNKTISYLAHANKIRKEGLLEKLLNLINYRIDRTGYGTACPSGTIMRFSVTFIILFLLFIQKNEEINVRWPLLKKVRVLLFSLMLLLFLAMARIYDFQHTLSDELFSSIFPVFFIILVAIIFKDKKRKGYEKLMASIHHGVLTLDKRGYVIECNSRIPKLLDVPKKNIINRIFFELSIFNGKKEIGHIRELFDRIVSGKKNEFTNLNISLNRGNKTVHFLISCHKLKKIIFADKFIITLYDLTERTALLKSIQNLFSHELDSKDELLSTLARTFQDLGFKRIRIYKVEGNELIGLKSFSTSPIGLFDGEKYSFDKIKYINRIIKNQQAELLTLSQLELEGMEYDKKIFQSIDIDWSTEWLDLPIMEQDKRNCLYFIGLDKGKGKKLHLDQELLEIINLLGKFLSILFKNIDYYEKIREENKTIIELLTLHNRKSLLYSIVDELKNFNLHFDDWVIYLKDEKNNLLKAVSSSIPNFYETKKPISLGEGSNQTEEEALLKNSYEQKDILYIKQNAHFTIASCLSGLRDRLGGILIHTRDNGFIEKLSEQVTRIPIKNKLNSCFMILERMLNDDIFLSDELSEITQLFHDLDIPRRQFFDGRIKDLGFDELSLKNAVHEAQEIIISKYKIDDPFIMKNGPFNFNEFILPLRLLIDYYARKNGLEVIYDVSNMIDIDLNIDYNKLRLVVYNVLDNAIKYSTTKEEYELDTNLPFGNITFQSWANQDKLVIEISNYGLSYPSGWEHNKFYCRRGNHEKINTIPGHGYGLQRSNKLLLKINGNIEVTNNYNPTTFKIEVNKNGRV